MKSYSFSVHEKQTEYKKVKLNSSRDTEKLLRRLFASDMLVKEVAYMLTVDKGNAVTGFHKLSEGGINSTIMDIRLVAKIALETLSCSVIVSHNHPSGQLIASEADTKMTSWLKAGLATIDIQLLDHIIMTEEGYYSYADNGRL